MTSYTSPPETYHQWLDGFQYINGNPKDLAFLEVLAQGNYLGIPSESFLCHLSDAVSKVLSIRCRQFLRQTDCALIEGEPDIVPLLAMRFRRDLRKCFFYRSLSFLPEDYVGELDNGFQKQLLAFWTDFLSQLKKSAELSADFRLEDLHHELKRIYIVQNEGGQAICE